MGNCCARGGCCRQAPPKIIPGPDGKAVRVNLLFDLGCCDHGKGVTDILPGELFANGLREAVVADWLAKLPAINSKRPTKCGGCMSCFFTFLVCPCFIGQWCRAQAKNVKAWDDDMRFWQEQFNKIELERINHYIKTQSRCDVTYDKDGKKRHIERWIAIALNAEESAKLKAEPHMVGDIETGCCGGPNETECCMHP